MTSLSTRNITVANTNSAINQIKTVANSYLAQNNSKLSKDDLNKLKEEILKELANIYSGKQLSKRALVVLIDNIKKYVSDSRSLIQANVGPIFSSKVQMSPLLPQIEILDVPHV